MKKYLGVSKVKLSSDNETLAENKILILYILDKLYAPIDNAPRAITKTTENKTLIFIIVPPFIN